MACGSCGTGVDGKPSGCRSNGGCSSGGCNRLNTYDWFGDIPAYDPTAGYRFMEISFKNGARKEIYRNPSQVMADKFDTVVVEGNLGGFDIGEVSLTGESVRLRMRRKNMQDNDARIRSVVRVANASDIEKTKEARRLEKETMVRARAIIREMNLEMKLGDVEYQGDGRKATFYYTADGRVDFRELIKIFSRDFRVKIEMKQIGARQEAGRIGGIGVCGRELCCSTWLTDFKSVVTQAARYQNLSINQQKLSGQCGRLKCCLNYELDSYMEALAYIPENAERLETENGTAFLQRVDIFKKLMWYQYEKSSVFHPVNVTRVKELLDLNRKGIKPGELGAEKIEAKNTVAEEKIKFVELTGDVTLEALKKSPNKKKKKPNRSDNRGQQTPDANNPHTTAPAGNRNDRGDRNTQPRRPDNQQGGKPGGGRPQSGQPRPPQNPNNQRTGGNRPPQGGQPRPQNRPQGRPGNRQDNAPGKPAGESQPGDNTKPIGE